jgi:hypothetical protein
MVVWMGVYALFNFINEIDLIGQHYYTTLSAIIYVAADLNGAINSPNKMTIKININASFTAFPTICIIDTPQPLITIN